MKKVVPIVILILFLQSCGNEDKPEKPKGQYSYELVWANKRNDTINLMVDGVKQGIWVTYTWTAKNREHAERVPVDTSYYKDGVEVKK